MHTPFTCSARSCSPHAPRASLAPRAPRALASTLLLSLMLAACGGGGDSDNTPTPTPTPPPTPAPALSAAQGIWQSAAGAAVSTSAIVLPDGGLWAVNVTQSVAGSTTQVLKATFSVEGTDYKATGRIYTLGSSAGAPSSTTVVDLPVSASVVEKSSLQVRVGADPGAVPLSLAWQQRYDTSATLAGFAGAWSGALGAGTLRWTIDAAGTISGMRTTGCTYTGQLSLRAERKAVVDAQVQEDCAGARTQLSGVATLNADAGRLSLVMTTADQAQAVLLALGR